MDSATSTTSAVRSRANRNLTEGNTQLTLHNESVETIKAVLRTVADLLEIFRLGGDPERLRTIANTIEAQS